MDVYGQDENQESRSHKQFACLNPVYILLLKVLAFSVLFPHLINGVLQTVFRMLRRKFYIHVNLN